MKHIAKIFIAAACLTLVSFGAGAQSVCYSLQKIWGDGTRHCAFTSLVEYKGIYYCAFRDGYSHIFNENGEADGKVQVIASKDGDAWESVALFEQEGYDLRDPKLSVMPDGRLMLLYGCMLYKDKKLVTTSCRVTFSEDGRHFSNPEYIKIDGTEQSWLWRVTWHKGTGYGVTYFRDKQGQKVRLLTTKDGIEYSVLKTLEVPDFPNEATVRFTADDKMLILLRRDGGSRSAMFLSAEAPYSEWACKDLGFHVGGPEMIVLPDGRVVIGGRSEYIRGHARTVLYTGTADGDFCETLVLPSAGDNSYPGFIVVGNELWATYYSSHETAKPSIYIAKIPLSQFFYK
jgi:hypothetical protein